MGACLKKEPKANQSGAKDVDLRLPKDQSAHEPPSRMACQQSFGSIQEPEEEACEDAQHLEIHKSVQYLVMEECAQQKYFGEEASLDGVELAMQSQVPVSSDIEVIKSNISPTGSKKRSKKRDLGELEKFKAYIPVDV